MNSNFFSVRYEASFEKSLKKLDRAQAKLVLAWIKKNLVETTEPRLHGKSLQGQFKGLWRYRVGNYRIIAEIKDNELIILLLAVAHRKHIYT
ncbi:type II toxin-antitoxin system RelE/ParE family toxin [Orbaceae bacterium ac157xtp]